MKPKLSDLLDILEKDFGCRIVDIPGHEPFTEQGEPIILLNGATYNFRYLEREHQGKIITCPIGSRIDEILSESAVRMIRNRLQIEDDVWPWPFD